MKPAAIPIAMQAAPTARARFGRSASTLERRIGSSIQWWVMIVGTAEAATTASPAGTESVPQTAAAKISAGQCQRYQE